MNGNIIRLPFAPISLDGGLPRLNRPLMDLILRDVHMVLGLHRVHKEEEDLDECTASLLNLLYMMQRFNLHFRGKRGADLVHLFEERIPDEKSDLSVSAKLALLLAIQDLYRLSDDEIGRVRQACFQ